MKPVIYLSGPIQGLNYQGATDWRDAIRNELEKYGIVGLCPMRAREELDHGEAIQPSKTDQLTAQNICLTQQAIVGRDYNDVLRADALLVNLLGAKTVSIGTMFEMAWAYQRQKPIYLAIEDAGNIHDHYFVKEALTFRSENIENLLKVLIGNEKSFT